jgi:hypothetical protein
MKPDAVRIFACLLLAVSGLVSCNAKQGVLNFSESAVTQALSRAPSSTDPYEVSMDLASRTYVHSVLKSIFEVPDDSNILDLHARVRKKLEFGGGCDRYARGEKPLTFDANGVPVTFGSEFVDSECAPYASTDLKAFSNPGRFGIMNSVCTSLVTNSNMAFLTNALVKVVPGWTPASTLVPNELHMIKIYQLFLPYEVPSPEIVAEFMKVSAKGDTNYKKWQYAVFLACILPDWHKP